MSRRISFQGVADARKHLDEPDILERAKNSYEVRLALEFDRPRNWWGIGVPASRLIEIAELDGIPLAWVPRLEIVRELASESDRDSRINVLMRRSNDVLDDCRLALDECTDPWIGNVVPLARCALEAFNDHHEAAMALAVALGEPLAIWGSQPRVNAYDSKIAREEWQAKVRSAKKYRRAEVELARAKVDPLADDARWRALASPIPKFFTVWYPNQGTPVPEELSRHVAVHQPTAEHFSRDNSLIALMLMTSLLRDQEDWSEEVRADEYSDLG